MVQKKGINRYQGTDEKGKKRVTPFKCIQDLSQKSHKQAPGTKNKGRSTGANTPESKVSINP
jgi:hypothetical protein